jgi:DnaJ-domain-containing protein 1
MPRLSELELAQRRIKKLEKTLKTLSDDVLVFLYLLDKQLENVAKTEQERFDRGRRIARISNWMDQRNDSVRYNSLGVSFRNDDKIKITKKLIAKMKADSLERNPALAEQVKPPAPAGNPPSKNGPGA